MIATIVYDLDGLDKKTIRGHRITTQIFSGTSTALVKVYNKKGKQTHSYQFSKVYLIEREL